MSDLFYEIFTLFTGSAQPYSSHTALALTNPKGVEFRNCQVVGSWFFHVFKLLLKTC